MIEPMWCACCALIAFASETKKPPKKLNKTNHKF